MYIPLKALKECTACLNRLVREQFKPEPNPVHLLGPNFSLLSSSQFNRCLTLFAALIGAHFFTHHGIRNHPERKQCPRQRRDGSGSCARLLQTMQAIVCIQYRIKSRRHQSPETPHSERKLPRGPPESESAAINSTQCTTKNQ
ncbi:hypothetical protein QVD17_03251 [Tagetes erecta]|uniref:Uncharacterized protein n=1 Tax=Tagetes erecta TaxID=13708 RepID=A0AAD8P373_TARER|nr:hypothetical protein QVD17_03251 [Tagetes erecta]